MWEERKVARGLIGILVINRKLPEDIDQNGLDGVIRVQEFERGCDLVHVGTAADVQKVGRAAAVQFDGVHGSLAAIG